LEGGELKATATTDQSIVARVADLFAAHASSMAVKCHSGVFVTTLTSMSKKRMRELLPEHLTSPVLEMESAAVAAVAASAGIPFVGVRTVSDDAGEELGFEIAEFTDAALRISPVKVMLTILRRPAIIPQLLRLARNTRVAGKNLAAALQVLAEEHHV